MTVLKFSHNEVRKIVEHTQRHPLMSPTFEHLMDPQVWKHGVKAGAAGWVEAKDVDTTKIQPFICLVKDAGIYLMSGSATKIPGTKSRNYVAYAKGYGADADYDAIVDAVGGDDFSENLPLAFFMDAFEPGGDIRLSVTAKTIKRLK